MTSYDYKNDDEIINIQASTKNVRSTDIVLDFILVNKIKQLIGLTQLMMMLRINILLTLIYTFTTSIIHYLQRTLVLI